MDIQSIQAAPAAPPIPKIEGRNHAWQLFEMAQQLQAEGDPEWFCQKLTVADTGAISVADIEAERREGMDSDLIEPHRARRAHGRLRKAPQRGTARGLTLLFSPASRAPVDFHFAVSSGASKQPGLSTDP
jgi:hypothetical protein